MKKYAFVSLIFLLAPAAQAQMRPPQYPIKAYDGETIVNFDVSAALIARLDKLPGKVAVGNLQGDVTLYQFYDLNCPYCRDAAADIDALVHSDAKLKLVFVPYAVLSEPSVRGAMVEVAAAKQLSPAQYLDFHKRIYASRGTIDGARVLDVAKDMGLDAQKLAAAANTEATLDILRENVAFGGQAGLVATPAYIIDGIAIVGHPGLKPLQTVIAAVRGCGKVVC
jgi:protein-disulfide isomerase